VEGGPWWAQAPFRLIVLFVILAGVSLYGIPRIIKEAAGKASGESPCTLAPPPPVMRMSLDGLRNVVAASGIRSLVGDGGVDTSGLQEPAAAWSDTPPTGVPSETQGASTVDAGYEILWWSREQDHQGATLFVFPTADDASRYLRQATSPRCRQDGASYPLGQPAGARGLVWVNPVDVVQIDVFFSRGNRVYRLSEVPPGSPGEGPSGYDIHTLMWITQQLACEIKDAACPSS
jgi:hypothetical protein